MKFSFVKSISRGERKCAQLAPSAGKTFGINVFNFHCLASASPYIIVKCFFLLSQRKMEKSTKWGAITFEWIHFGRLEMEEIDL